MQSKDYVPGVSGWKIDPTGDFELNSTMGGEHNLDPEPRSVKVELFDMLQQEMPTGFAELNDLLKDHAARAPAGRLVELQYYVDETTPDWPVGKVTMFYRRPENAEEVAARIKANQPRRLVIKNGSFSYYSGGQLRCRVGDLSKPEPVAVDREAVSQPAEPAPFIVVDGVTYIRQAESASDFKLKLSINSNGQYVAAGVGIGLYSQLLVGVDRLAFEQSQRDATKILDELAATLSRADIVKTPSRCVTQDQIASIQDQITALQARLADLQGSYSR